MLREGMSHNPREKAYNNRQTSFTGHNRNLIIARNGNTVGKECSALFVGNRMGDTKCVIAAEEGFYVPMPHCLQLTNRQ